MFFIYFSNMESFLPVLLIIAGVVYKIYTEFQKEQEKARKRQPNRPVPPAVPVPAPVATQRKSNPIPTVSKPIPPLPKQVIREAVPTEVEKLRNKKKETQERRKVLVTPQVEVLPEPALHFDLRQAVIQSVILERPYKD